MKKVSYELSGGLSQQQLQTIHEKALDMLDNIGIKIPHKQTLDILREHDGVRVEGDIVYFPAQLVNKLTKGVTKYPHHNARLLAGAYSHHYRDPATGQIRQPQWDDLVYSVKVAEALGMETIAPVTPFDIDGDKMEPAMFKAVYENSTKSYGGGQITTVKSAEAVYEMSQVVGANFDLELWVISPLTLDSTHLDIIFEFKDRKPDIWVSNMPLLGSSAPIFAEAGFIQTVAECLAVVTTLKLIVPESEITYRSDAFYLYPIDMRSTYLSWCSPEYIQLAMIQAQLAHFYGFKPMGKSMICMSKEPDGQACAEKAMATTMFALANAEHYVGAGTLGGVDIFSPEQLIIDKEIFDHIMYFTAPKQYDFNKDYTGIYKDVKPGGNFLTHDTTLENFKDTFLPLSVFNHESVMPWIQKGASSLIDRVKAKLDSLELRKESVLDKNQQQELDRIFNAL